ncbi:MAG: response regulator [Deltaproteobacteria bacterium]|nr:response regulator [Deltaproteobacteria bacterium]
MEADRVFLLPGEYIISKKPHDVTTLLGSCVAVCLYSKTAKFGGVNHYMLPSSGSGSWENNAKYGDYSIQTLIQFMERGAGTLEGTEAMIFGGANVVGAIKSGANIGEKNVELARQMLKDHRIPITKEVVGGFTGMKIRYQTWDNHIEYRQIERSQFAQTMLAKEEQFEKNKIKVLIVDDSAIVRRLLSKAIEDETDIEVVGQAKDAFEAREMLLETNPDVITLDIIMPKMDGVTFLKKLMVYYPKPVIICSTIAKAGSKVELRADKIGAVDVIDKESLNIYQGMETVKKVLIPKIRSAARSFVKKRSKDEIMDI